MRFNIYQANKVYVYHGRLLDKELWQWEIQMKQQNSTMSFYTNLPEKNSAEAYTTWRSFYQFCNYFYQTSYVLMTWTSICQMKAVISSVLRGSLSTWCLSKTGPLFCSMFKPLGIIFAIITDVIVLGDALCLGRYYLLNLRPLQFFSPKRLAHFQDVRYSFHRRVSSGPNTIKISPT